jgi:hypothetical protein
MKSPAPVFFIASEPLFGYFGGFSGNSFNKTPGWPNGSREYALPFFYRQICLSRR